MATFDATLGGSQATSYISLADADAYFTGSMQESAWNGYTDAEKQSALMAATSWLETLTYEGTRCSPSTDDTNLPQQLQWPRSGFECKGITATCSAIPTAIKAGACLLALQLLKNPDAIIPEGGGGSSQPGVFVSKQRLGDLEQEFTEYSNPLSNNCDTCGDPPVISAFPWLPSVLSCWYKGDGLVNGSGLMLRVRS